ncbi:TonB-dependent siderophore receptor [Motiliproteus sp. MSK22-1]|uniref:TonB-dependent receptor plug domain-containing protein n=1 Tax=Motiliproteus sp. MSK22-1 TaxID=1897630 RepID=UPI000978D03F|nr:TonB-dependent receptor [Motiliproteus sp. MSK22-1]OMH39652.1 hypothetical protein BGP75_02100 [Motiliproteus sp. MSK22-1]
MSDFCRGFGPWCSFIILSLASNLSFSQENELLTEGDLLESLPTVKSATRLEQKLSDVPSAMTIIDQKMIKASGAVNVVDLFRLVPGFQTYHVNANKFGVVSHGQGNSHPGRLEVMIDGRSVYLSLLSTVDWSALGITLNDIDYIEVVRGSNVPTQGSNAFLGAINIITREPLKDQGSYISVTRGALKTEDYYLRHNDKVGSLDYRISANFHKNNGTGIGFENGDATTSPLSIEDGGEISQFNFRGTYTPTLSDSFDIQLGVSSGQFGVGRSNHPEEFATRDVDSHFQSLVWTRNLSGENELKVQAYHNYLKYDQTIPFFVPESSLFPNSPSFTLDVGVEDGVSERYDIDIELTHRFNEHTRSVWGAGIRYESLKSQALLNSNETVDEWLFRGSGNLEHQLNKYWTINAGAMLENNDISGSRFSPRLGVNYHINVEHSLRGSISRAYRTPSLLEANEALAVVIPDRPEFFSLAGVTFDQISQPAADLGPEKVSTLELGYLWQDLDGHWTFDTKFYIEEVDNAIDEFSVPFFDLKPNSNIASENRNVAEWQTKGLELQLKLQPWQHTWLYLAYAYADAKGHHNEDSENSISLDNRVPTHTLALQASHDFGNALQGSFTFYRESSVSWKGGAELDSYNRLDARLEKGFSFGETEGSIEFIMQNLLSTYKEFDVNNNFDTRAFIRLNLNFL